MLDDSDSTSADGDDGDDNDNDNDVVDCHHANDWERRCYLALLQHGRKNLTISVSRHLGV